MTIICVYSEMVFTTGHGICGGFNYGNFAYIRFGALATIGLFALPLFNFLTKTSSKLIREAQEDQRRPFFDWVPQATR